MITHKRYIKTGNVTSVEEEVIHNGKWWLPSDPDNMVNGTLRISNSKGIVLELFSNIIYGFLEKDFVDYEIINGETREGGLVTLHNCFEVVKKSPLGHGEIHQVFRCKALFWGNNFKSVSQLIFQHFQLKFPYNNNFFIDSMFDRDYAKNMITYSDSYEFEVDMDNVKIILTNYNLIKENIYSINLEKQGMFIIKSDDKITLEEFNITQSSFRFKTISDF